MQLEFDKIQKNYEKAKAIIKQLRDEKSKDKGPREEVSQAGAKQIQELESKIKARELQIKQLKMLSNQNQDEKLDYYVIQNETLQQEVEVLERKAREMESEFRGKGLDLKILQLQIQIVELDEDIPTNYQELVKKYAIIKLAINTQGDHYNKEIDALYKKIQVLNFEI